MYCIPFQYIEFITNASFIVIKISSLIIDIILISLSNRRLKLNVYFYGVFIILV